LPLNQLAFSVLDLKTTERWWREGLGFLPAGGNRLLFRGPVMDAIQGMQGVATTCWCLLGRNDWAQVEMFQYEAPMSKRMPPDFKPNHIGYTRCGLWVADFDAALTNLARLGTQPLAPPIGEAGNRRVCVRNPDGVYVEL
jgi:catechol 2,3-dioxygenase-like lactoylglutathione lyase family enzyme